MPRLELVVHCSSDVSSSLDFFISPFIFVEFPFGSVQYTKLVTHQILKLNISRYDISKRIVLYHPHSSPGSVNH